RRGSGGAAFRCRAAEPPPRARRASRARAAVLEVRRRPHESGDRAAHGPQRIERRHAAPPHGGGPARRVAEERGAEGATPDAVKTQREEHLMDDRFLNPLRQEPDPRFARGLREKLRAQESQVSGARSRLTPALAGAFALAVIVALFAFPSVRASAQAMLDLFRVKKFTALPFDQARVDKLQQLDKDRMLMVFDKTETVREPGPPQMVTSIAAATSAAGFHVASPSYLPAGLSADTIRVDGPAEAKLSVSEAKLRSLLDALDLDDVQVPAGLDGKEIQVRKAPIVIQQFHATGK